MEPHTSQCILTVILDDAFLVLDLVLMSILIHRSHNLALFWIFVSLKSKANGIISSPRFYQKPRLCCILIQRNVHMYIIC